MAEVVPGISVLAVVFTDRAPLSLTQIGTPLSPGILAVRASCNLVTSGFLFITSPHPSFFWLFSGSAVFVRGSLRKHGSHQAHDPARWERGMKRQSQAIPPTTSIQLGEPLVISLVFLSIAFMQNALNRVI
jgi:hypothetical protein